MSQADTPKKKVVNRGRPVVNETGNDFCRICKGKCKFKLVRCSTINIFERSTRANFNDIVLANLCKDSNVELIHSENLSSRVCVTWAKKRRDFCLTSKEIVNSLNKPHESFSTIAITENDGEPGVEQRYKRLIPMTSEHSPTARKISKDSSGARETSQKSIGKGKRKSKRYLFGGKDGEYSEERNILDSLDSSISAASLLYNIEAYDAFTYNQENPTEVAVAIKTPNGNVTVRHVNEKTTASVVRNFAQKNWKAATFSILKCECLMRELLYALNKHVSK